MSRKFLSMILAGCLTVSLLAGCGGNEVAKDSTSQVIMLQILHQQTRLQLNIGNIFMKQK